MRNLRGVCRAVSAGKMIRVLLALAVSAACFLCFSAANAVKLPIDGDRRFYLYSASSQAVVRARLSLGELPFLKGESVTVQTDYEKSVKDRIFSAREEVEQRGGVIVLEECAGGVYSLYCYLPEDFGLYDGIFVDGNLVNLHIAISKTRTAVGSPIIFGGY